MARTEVLNRYILRKDSSEKWTENNPILALGEVGYDTTHKYFKIGDGSTSWDTLKYYCEEDFTALTGRAAALEGRATVLEGSVTSLSASDGELATSITANITAITSATDRIGTLESKATHLNSDGTIAADNITYTLNEQATNIKSVVDDLVTSAGYVGSYNGNFNDISEDLLNLRNNLSAANVSYDKNSSINTTKAALDDIYNQLEENITPNLNSMSTNINGLKPKVSSWQSYIFEPNTTDEKTNYWAMGELAYELIGIQATNLSTDGSSFTGVYYFTKDAIKNNGALSAVGTNLTGSIQETPLSYVGGAFSSSVVVKLKYDLTNHPNLTCKIRLVYRQFELDKNWQ